MEEDWSRETPPPLPILADGKFRHVDPGLIPVARIRLAITSGIILVAALLALMFLALDPEIERGVKLAFAAGWLALIPVLGVATWFWPKKVYLHIFYCLKPDCLVIRSGVFWKVETIIPKSRIQHTDVAQGPLQRAYEISELIIHTAGTREAVVTLTGLSERMAPVLRDRLLDRTDDDNYL